MIPVRCFTCGKPIAHLYEKYKELIAKGVKPEKALNEAGLERYCCKGLFTGHVELIDKTAIYKKF
ncbi:MAG TPA: DNA-directed RNA polymerase subunit N [Candidatus Nanoarchaeia archaeon]|nr:DNA-directed RNA polymerase subunit N [Candidatus Nanoarchaeia archaeon]